MDVVGEDGGLEVWIKELPTGPFTRLAFEGTISYRPAGGPAADH